MDKAIFFNSLPFMSKLSTEAWPPNVTGFVTNDSSSVHLVGFYLSVEVDNGPIFLRNSHHGDDPAMFAVDLMILEPILGSPSSASTTLSHGTPSKSMMNRPTAATTTIKRMNDQEESSSSMVILGEEFLKTNQQLFLRLDQAHVYRVDLSRTVGIDRDVGNSGQRQQQEEEESLLPDSILLRFYECSLRLFRYIPLTDRNIASDGGQYSSIEDAYQALQNLPRNVSGMLSPSSSKDPLVTPDAAALSTKQKLLVMETSRQELVDRFLYEHLATWSATKVGQQLDLAAQSLSYVSPIELELAVGFYHQKLESTEMELESLLTYYFPHAKQHQQQRQRFHEQDQLPHNHNNGTAEQQPTVEECLEMVSDLIRQKKSYLEQRHDLVLLPLRI